MYNLIRSISATGLNVLVNEAMESDPDLILHGGIQIKEGYYYQLLVSNPKSGIQSAISSVIEELLPTLLMLARDFQVRFQMPDDGPEQFPSTPDL